MDTRLLRYYERELQHLRETGGEFAREFPKVAGRLGLESFACADPYVERLLEGFSFLAARVQMKIDAEFPRFTEHLLELVYPHYLAPTPSMAVVQFAPDLAEGSLAAGFTLPRGTALKSILGKNDQTPCEYRSAHDVTLWPLEIAQAQYFAHAGEIGGVDFSRLGKVRAVLRLRLRATAALAFNELSLERLTVHLRGADAVPGQLYEQIFSNALAVIAMPARANASWHEVIDRAQLRRVGFSAEEALLPHGPRSFHGYRLLQEYFAFPQRYQFVEFGGLAQAVRRCRDNELDVLVLFDRLQPSLEGGVGTQTFGLFCAPAINLFPKRADRIHLSNQQAEFHVIPDRTRPMDFEIHQVLSVTGYGSGKDEVQPFRPFYSANDLMSEREAGAYYQVRRARRVLSERQRRQGPRSSYIGSEMFVSLVDPLEAPYRSDLRQLGAELLCTNRDLPLSMPLGLGKTDFTLEASAPVQAVRCVAGPTAPAPSYAEGEVAWRVVSHLSLNYLSLLDQDEKEGAVALRDLLRLYVGTADTVGQRQIEGVRSMSSQPVVRRIPGPGPIAYGRGLQIAVTMDENAFEGAGVFLFGSVLEQFFARYASLNTFTETVVRSTTRGDIMKWPARSGRCEIL
ncbi:type VI secretion system protein ImpG [Paraburkholderia ginsengiterrae]|uniref:Type VI secretion system protein ImpG n=1 Tax=Paraburkholderia ginsengiterrae TaxID=1462993 RepID=A0ABX2UVN5_9BURK|nr:type VI secretion system baseplate subunit TssF [Paraburkholderia ginsengiterrae]OAJ58746.1 type VI secretion system protein ImpG [Paraburkholderia ginsengiterrae]